MHEERKKWMLSEMAARIPYGVQVQYNQKDYNVVGIYKGKLLLEDSEGKSEQAEVTEVYTYLIDAAHIREQSDRDTLVKSILGSDDTKGFIADEFVADEWTLGIHNKNGSELVFNCVTVEDYVKWFYYNQVQLTQIGKGNLSLPVKVTVTPKPY